MAERRELLRLVISENESGHVEYEATPFQLYDIPKVDQLALALSLRRLADAVEGYVPFGQVIRPQEKTDAE